MFGRIFSAPKMASTSPHADAYYERYRQGLVQRHICRNGRLLQATLLVQQDDNKPTIDSSVHRNRRITEEKTADNKPFLYSAYPAILSSGPYVVGGGDNPLLSGGLAMMMFSIESLLNVSHYSLEYATHLLRYFETSQVAPGKLYRKRNWWRAEEHVSKDEMTGMLLGLDFYIRATKKAGKLADRARALKLMKAVGVYLRNNNYSPAYTWVFQFPFTRLFKFNLGTSLLSGVTIPNNPATGDELLDLLVKILKTMTFVNWWYKPKHLYRDTCQYLPLAYQAASELDAPRKFFNVALYCHTIQMIFNQPVSRSVRKEMWRAFLNLFEYFAYPGSPAGAGEGYENALLGVVAHAFARKVGSDAVTKRAIEMYRSILYPDPWAPNLPMCCLDGCDPLLHHYYGKTERYWGERFTWEHRDPKGHVLNWTWGKVHGSIGPPDVGMLNHLVGPPYYHADPTKGFVVEAVGLGLPVVRALAAYYGLAPSPKLRNDECFHVLDVDGPSPT